MKTIKRPCRGFRELLVSARTSHERTQIFEEEMGKLAVDETSQ